MGIPGRRGDLERGRAGAGRSRPRRSRPRDRGRCRSAPGGSTPGPTRERRRARPGRYAAAASFGNRPPVETSRPSASSSSTRASTSSARTPANAPYAGSPSYPCWATTFERPPRRISTARVRPTDGWARSTTSRIAASRSPRSPAGMCATFPRRSRPSAAGDDDRRDVGHRLGGADVAAGDDRRGRRRGRRSAAGSRRAGSRRPRRTTRSTGTGASGRACRRPRRCGTSRGRARRRAPRSGRARGPSARARGAARPARTRCPTIARTWSGSAPEPAGVHVEAPVDRGGQEALGDAVDLLAGELGALDEEDVQALVLGLGEQQRPRGQAVAPGAPGLLVPGLERGGDADVRDRPHVRLVHAHAERVRRDDDVHLAVHEPPLHGRAALARQPRVVDGDLDPERAPRGPWRPARSARACPP